MKQTIVKRPANITSQEALSQLVLEYPHSEVLSFRRVKSAGMDGDYFVATLRVAEFDEVEEAMDNDEIVTESEFHEEGEEEKLDKIIDMIEKLIEKDEEVHEAIEEPEQSLLQKRPPLKNPVPMQPMANKNCQCWDGYKRVPGTKPCAPGSCEKCDSASKNSMVVIERPADISQKRARLEILREFGKEYKIARLAKTGSIYSATLVKRTNDECQCCKDGSCDCDCHKDGMNKAMNAVDTAANLIAEAKRKRLASLRKRSDDVSPEQKKKLDSLYKMCPACHGRGQYNSDHPEADDEMECGDCDGSGIVEN
jgi:hypothetical protein